LAERDVGEGHGVSAYHPQKVPPLAHRDPDEPRPIPKKNPREELNQQNRIAGKRMGISDIAECIFCWAAFLS